MASNSLINVEVEASKSEVHLNYPVVTREEEKVRIKSRVPSSVRAWMESSKYGEDEKSRNIINVPLAREKSTLEHRSNNIPRTVENVAHAQPSVSPEEDEIRNSNFEHVPSKRPSEALDENDRKPAAKRIKKEPEDDAQSVTQD